MKITEVETDADIPGKAFKFTCDEECEKIPPPLPRCLNFFWLICGKSGMGKSTLLMNLLTRRKSPYRKCFDKIYVWSPSLDTMEDNPFEALPEEQLFEDLTEENLTQVLHSIKDSGFKVLIVLDDVVNSMKSSREVETILTRISHNRRHLCGKGGSCSIIATSQVFKNKVPMPIRKNCSHFITFNPSKADLDCIYQEFVMIEKKHFEMLCRHVFQRKRDFLYMDLTQDAESMFHRNWNRLDLGGV